MYSTVSKVTTSSRASYGRGIDGDRVWWAKHVSRTWRQQREQQLERVLWQGELAEGGGG